MTNEVQVPKSPPNESELIVAAFRLVEACLDGGSAFEARCRSSADFERAVDDAWFLRAYDRGALRRRVREGRAQLEGHAGAPRSITEIKNRI